MLIPTPQIPLCLMLSTCDRSSSRSMDGHVQHDLFAGFSRTTAYQGCSKFHIRRGGDYDPWPF